ncbi:phosphoglycerate dehydrogenase [Candidatus Micrarchaeota archaeon]|nr:phosphoglycerate dehydrogenase [Candidatus Micrarchaeota archaeon]MBU1165860.1 phosphoglycerate dehydrogenase [Candidatus Micrarchaeota archaeon]MBU1887022.1 phosphoglycerate dehydrogenase [Candidatus Micrarchaeota archaeon]
MKILISTSSFGKYDKAPLEKLKENDLEIVLNPHGRKLTKDETIQLAKGCVGILAGTEVYDESVLKELLQLKYISRCGIGMDSIDLGALKKHDIKIMNTPEAPTQAVAELTVAFMLDCMRRVTMLDAKVKKGEWKKETGYLLAGKTVGIIGLGRIGRRVVELLKPFGVVVLAYEPRPDDEWVAKNNVKLVGLEELLCESNIVSLHIPYNKETHDFINSNTIKLMKDNAVLINTSRGGIVNESALYDALRSGKLGMAALDVMEKEPYNGQLKELDNIILTPHIGSFAKESRIRMETEAAENLIKMLGE